MGVGTYGGHAEQLKRELNVAVRGHCRSFHGRLMRLWRSAFMQPASSNTAGDGTGLDASHD
jgi:hypothetical protein